MRKMIAPFLFTALMAAGAALADGKVYVTLPNMAPVAEDEADADRFLSEMYVALVLASNCTTTTLSSEEHSLLTDGFDLLAYGEMAMTTDQIVAKYEEPAFRYLDADPNSCTDADARKQAVLARLIGLGGSLTPLADQEQGYEDWRVLMDAIRP